MRQASIGDTVKVECVMRAGGETVLDSRAAGSPLRFMVGGGEVFRSLERSVLGMHPGELKIVELDAAFGGYRDDLRWAVDRSRFPEVVRLGARVHVRLAGNDESLIRARVTSVSASTVTLDGNHPLAGQRVSFEIELLEIA